MACAHSWTLSQLSAFDFPRLYSTGNGSHVPSPLRWNSTTSALPISPSLSERMGTPYSMRTFFLDSYFAVSTFSCMILPSAVNMFSLQACSMWIRAHCLGQYTKCCKAESMMRSSVFSTVISSAPSSLLLRVSSFLLQPSPALRFGQVVLGRHHLFARLFFKVFSCLACHFSAFSRSIFALMKSLCI